MKQRFSISRDTGGDNIVIREYAELDKGAYSLLCEESYPAAALREALANGPGQVISLLRSESFFPTRFFAEKLTTHLEDYFKQGHAEDVKIDVDDAECLQVLPGSDAEEEDGTIDDLLDVETEEVMDEEEPVAKLDAPIKIAEDDSAEIRNSL